MMNDGSRNCDLARGRLAADRLDYRGTARDSTPVHGETRMAPERIRRQLILQRPLQNGRVALPALFKYFPKAPRDIYVRPEAEILRVADLSCRAHAASIPKL